MGFLDTQLAGNTLLQWLAAVLIVVGGTILLGLVRRFLGRRLRSLADRTENDVDDLLAELVQRTKSWVLFLLTLAAASWVVELPGGWSGRLRAISIVALLIQAGLWGTDVLSYGIKRMLARRRAEDADERQDEAMTAGAFTLFRLLGRILVWSAVMLLILDNLGIDITALVAGLGVGGIAVALAVQNILGDLFASFSILLDKPFVVGDFIIVGDHLGTVERIGIKTTRVRSLSGEQLIFANNDLLQSRIRNYKRMAERRVVFSVGVVYQTPAEKLARLPEVLREIVESVEQTRFDRAHFQKYGDFSLDFEIVYYVLSADYNIYMDIQQRINLAIFGRFAELGVEFAYPTRTLFLTSEQPEEQPEARYYDEGEDREGRSAGDGQT